MYCKYTDRNTNQDCTAITHSAEKASTLTHHGCVPQDGGHHGHHARAGQQPGGHLVCVHLHQVEEAPFVYQGPHSQATDEAATQLRESANQKLIYQKEQPMTQNNDLLKDHEVLDFLYF